MTRFKYGLLGILAFVSFILWQTNFLEVTKTAELRDEGNLQEQGDLALAEPNSPSEQRTPKTLDLSSAEALAKEFEGIDLEALNTGRGSRTKVAYYWDRTIRGKKVNVTQEEIDVHNKFHVIPFNPVVDTVCTEVPTNDLPDPEDPTFSSTKSCEYILERPHHPYYALGIEELTVLAVTDAVAAMVMVRKVRDPQERLRWSLRASALAAKSGPLLKLVNFDYTLGGLTTNRYESGDIGPIAVRVALENVMAKLSDPRANPSFWGNHLKEVSAENYEENLQLSQRLESSFLKEMVTVQLQVGRTDLMEVLKDA